MKNDDLKCIELKPKQEALDFLRQHRGYYEVVVDEHLMPTYIVFYK